MNEGRTRGGIAAIILAVVVGVGLAGVLLARAFDTEPPVTVAGPIQTSQSIDIPAVYDPVSAGAALPDGFRQLLGRDQIEPVYDPQYTSADQVDWPDGMLVLGVEGTDTAKAYPITHLNQREMVIDDLDGLPILVSW